jgi:glutathione S-transferase
MTVPILYIANKNYSSWSLRPWVLLRERGVDFEERLVPFAADGSGAGFARFSPTAKVPCLVDDDTTVWDSLAITEYLAERVAGVWPADAAARAWARCACAEMHSGFGTLREQCSMSCGVRVKLHALSPAVRRDLARIEALWNEGLARFGGPWLAGGAFSAVDAFFAPVAFRARTYGLPLGPLAQGYADRLLALPSLREWDRAACAEPWRDPAHDGAVAAGGEILQDLRAAP